MQTRAIHLFSVLMLLVTVAIFLPACTTLPTNNATGSAVAEAYASSSIVAVQPYTRTIFSSNNF